MREYKGELIASGRTSGGVEWQLREDTLYLDEGDYIGGSVMPWAPYRDQIRHAWVDMGFYADLSPRAFEYCTALETVKLGCLREISSGAFRCCTSLKNVELPFCLAWLYEDAFRYCTSLTAVIFPEELWQLGDGAFYGCSNLTTVVVGEGLFSESYSGMYGPRYCGDTGELELADVFEGCDKLRLIILPPGYEDVTVDIKNAVVCSCPEELWPLTYDSLSSFEKTVGAVSGCANTMDKKKAATYDLADCGVRWDFDDETGELWLDIDDEDSMEYIWLSKHYNDPKDGSELPWAHLRGQIKRAKIGTEVDHLPAYAFDGCASLKEIGLVEVFAIGRGAFRGCTGLERIKFHPENLTEVHEDAFRGCTGLKSVILSDDLWLLGCGAFADCTNLTTVVIGRGLLRDNAEDRYQKQTQTLKLADVFTGCKKLKNILLPPGYEDVTVDMEDVTVFSVPEALWPMWYEDIEEIVEEDLKTTFWKGNYLRSGAPKDFRIPDGFTKIAANTFCVCNLTSVTVPASVKTIGTNAFTFTDLTSVVLEEGLEEIGWGAFAECRDLTEIRLPTSLWRIDECAFAGCSSLQEIFIPKEIVEIGAEAFKDCTQLKTLTIEATLQEAYRSVGKEAFMGCVSLTEVEIPEGLPWVGEGAFRNCTGLRTAYISRGIISVHKTAFEGCTNLEKIIETEVSHSIFY